MQCAALPPFSVCWRQAASRPLLRLACVLLFCFYFERAALSGRRSYFLPGGWFCFCPENHTLRNKCQLHSWLCASLVLQKARIVQRRKPQTLNKADL
jgi:hypothetical protein